MFLNYIEIYAGDINIDDKILENVDTNKFGDKNLTMLYDIVLK